ncbi:MAG: hypothetical protein QNK04_27255 [Myxococcota bacterium]|nr:hypothetical protein [Myxococcota bacterium]
MERVQYEEWQLTSLFEVEPEHPFPEDPWPYGEVIYSVSQHGLNLRGAIHPVYRDVHLTLDFAGHTVYELRSMDLDRIEYVEDPKGESLRLVLSDRDHIVLRIKPTIRLAHEVSGTA